MNQTLSSDSTYHFEIVSASSIDNCNLDERFWFMRIGLRVGCIQDLKFIFEFELKVDLEFKQL